jgi:hypothetical protein
MLVGGVDEAVNECEASNSPPDTGGEWRPNSFTPASTRAYKSSFMCFAAAHLNSSKNKSRKEKRNRISPSGKAWRTPCPRLSRCRIDVDPARRTSCPARIDIDPGRNDLRMAWGDTSPARNELSEVWNRSPAGSIDIAAARIDVDPSRKRSSSACKPFEPGQTDVGLSQTRLSLKRNASGSNRIESGSKPTRSDTYWIALEYTKSHCRRGL